MDADNHFYIKKQFMIAACLSIGNLITGCTIAWTAPVIPKLQDLKQSPLPEEVSLSQASWIGSSYIIGGLVGPYLSAYLSNIIGRKLCLLIGATATMMGYLITSFARNYPVVITGRAVTGFGTGIIGVLHLVYIGEIASPKIRGILLTSFGVCQNIGCFVMYSTGAYLSYQTIGYMVMSFNILYLLGCLYVPESPLYHAMKGSEKKAARILTDLGRAKDAQKELQNLMSDFKQEKEYRWSWRELISIKCNRKSLFITVSIYVLQECSGMLAVLFFATTIFEKADSSIDPGIATIIMGATQLVTILVATLTVEKLGRKTLLLMSTGGYCISMVLLGVYFYIDHLESPSIANVRWLPLLLLVMSISSYSLVFILSNYHHDDATHTCRKTEIRNLNNYKTRDLYGLGIIPNTLIGEMYRPNVRSIGTSISMTSGWIAGIISVTSFGYIMEALGSYFMFFIYAIINLFGFIFIMFVVPETKGLTLKEIEIMLS